MPHCVFVNKMPLVTKSNIRWSMLGPSLLLVCDAILSGLCLLTLCLSTKRGLQRISPRSFSFSPSHFTYLCSASFNLLFSSSPCLPLYSCPTSLSPPDQPHSPLGSLASLPSSSLPRSLSLSHSRHGRLAGKAVGAAGQFSILDVRPQIETQACG